MHAKRAGTARARTAQPRVQPTRRIGLVDRQPSSVRASATFFIVGSGLPAPPS